MNCDDPGPVLTVTAGPCAPDGPGAWQASWGLTCPTPCRVLESWLPHDHFYGDRERHDPPLTVKHELQLKRNVRCQELLGNVIENAFLILRIQVAGETYRVFARLTVRIDQEGTPHQTCEAVTLQRIGG